MPGDRAPSWPERATAANRAAIYLPPRGDDDQPKLGVAGAAAYFYLAPWLGVLRLAVDLGAQRSGSDGGTARCRCALI